MADDADAPTSGRRGTLRAVAGVLTTLIAVAAIALSSYWLYYKHRETSLTTRSYRALTLLGRQLNSYLDGYRAILVARAKNGSGREAVKEFGGGFLWDPPAAVPQAARSRPRTIPSDAVTTHYTREDGRAHVHLCTFGGSYDAEPLCVSKRLDDVLQSLRMNQYGFDALVVASADGRAWAQAGSLTLILTALDEGIKAARDGGDASPDQGVDKKDASKTPPRPPVSVVRTASTPDVTFLAGQRYLLFGWGPLQSDDAFDPQLKDGDPLWLVGFAPETAFRANVQRIPYRWLITALVILLLMALSWQLLKLRWLAPQERLQAVDVHVLGLSVLGLAGALTILVCAYDAHTARTARQHADLATLATALEARLRTEIAGSSAQLSAYHVTECNPAAPCCVMPRRIETRHIKHLLRLDDDGFPLCWFTPTPDKDGAPEWTLESARLTRTSYADRGYFADARAGRMWRIRFGPDAAARKVAVEAVRGRISNVYELVVARPVDAPSWRKTNVLVVSTNPQPFTEPVLPEGYGFALVNEDGKVLFHSESSRNLSENLFEESEDTPELRLAVATHTPAAFDMRYVGNEYATLVHPIERPGEWVPWSIVVFRDKYVLRALNSETLLGASTMFACHLVLIVVGLVLLHLTSGPYHAKWLWPERRRSAATIYLLTACSLFATGLLTLRLVDGRLDAYPLVAPGVVLFVVAACSLVLGAKGGERAPAFVGLVAAGWLVALGCRHADRWFPLTLAILWTGVWGAAVILRFLVSDRATSDRQYRTVYVAMLAGIVFVLGVLPAILMVHESARYVDIVFGVLSREQREQRHEQRDAGIMTHVTNERMWVLQERCEDHGDIYDLADDGTVVHPASTLTAFLFGRLPTLGDLSARLRNAPTTLPVSSTSAHGPCCDPARSDACLTKSIAGEASPGPDRASSHAATAAMTVADSLSAPATLGVPWWLLAILAALPILYVLADSARRIFLLDLDADDTDDGSASPPSSASGGWRMTRRGTSPPAVTKIADDLDAGLGSEAIAAWRKDHAILQDYASVTIRNFDLGLDDDKSRAALLALLTRLVFSTRAAIVLIAMEPPVAALMRTPRKADGGAASATENPVTQWLLVLAEFRLQPMVDVPHARVNATVRHWLTWNRRSRAEQLALRQLADEGFANPNNRDVVHDLLAAGILHRDRGVDFRDPSFASFVRHVVPEATVERWEEAGASGGWEDVRAHLGAVVAVMATIIFVTQPDLLNTVALTLAGVTAGIPTVMKLVSLLGGEKRDAH